MTSPFDHRPRTEWLAITRDVIARHPVPTVTLSESVLAAWTSIFRSQIGDLRIGQDIFPQPQVMGFFLHELIPVELCQRVGGWRRGLGTEKDAHFELDSDYSFEIKTSSHPRQSLRKPELRAARRRGSAVEVRLLPRGQFRELERSTGPAAEDLTHQVRVARPHRLDRTGCSHWPAGAPDC